VSVRPGGSLILQELLGAVVRQPRLPRSPSAPRPRRLPHGFNVTITAKDRFGNTVQLHLRDAEHGHAGQQDRYCHRHSRHRADSHAHGRRGNHQGHQRQHQRQPPHRPARCQGSRSWVIDADPHHLQIEATSWPRGGGRAHPVLFPSPTNGCRSSYPNDEYGQVSIEAFRLDWASRPSPCSSPACSSRADVPSASPPTPRRTLATMTPT